MQKNKKPLVSVLITAYNAENYLVESVMSIVKQTYKKMEIIIVDDNSDDHTLNISNNLAHFDKRIQVFHLDKHSGPSIASNYGLEKVKGKFIARMDADDIATSDRIEKQVKFLEKNKDVVILGGQCILIDENGKIIGRKKYPEDNKKIYKSLYEFNPVQHPTCMIRQSTIKKYEVSYHNHTFLAHDLELVFELSKYGKLANLKDTTLFYRQYKNSLSLKDPKKTFEATVEVRKKALIAYKYKPSIKGWFIHFSQRALIAILPESFIYPLFCFLRMRKLPEININLNIISQTKKAWALAKTYLF